MMQELRTKLWRVYGGVEEVLHQKLDAAAHPHAISVGCTEAPHVGVVNLDAVKPALRLHRLQDRNEQLYTALVDMTWDLREIECAAGCFCLHAAGMPALAAAAMIYLLYVERQPLPRCCHLPVSVKAVRLGQPMPCMHGLRACLLNMWTACSVDTCLTWVLAIRAQGVLAA